MSEVRAVTNDRLNRFIRALRAGVGAASVEPKYAVVARLLAESISDGVWSETGRLPSESALGAYAGVSTNVIKKATVLLLDQGLVVREPGVGTRVLEKHGREQPADRFPDELPQRTPVTLRRTAVSTAQLVSAVAATALGATAGDKLPTVVRRLSVGARTVAVLTSHLRANLMVDLDLVTSWGLYAALDRCRARPVHGIEEIGARLATVEEQAALQLCEGTWVLATSRTASDRTGQPIEITTGVYDPAFFVGRTVLTRSA